MIEIEQNQVKAPEGQAGSEQAFIAPKNIYQLIQTLDTTQAVSAKLPFSGLFEDRFADSGIVEIQKILLVYTGKDGDKIRAAVGSTMTAAAVDTIASGPLGHKFNFSAYNTGPKMEVELGIGPRFSRRVRGTNVGGVAAQLMISASKGMDLQICWEVVLHGSEIIYETLKV